MSNGVTNETQVNVSPVPGAWRIIPAESPLQSDGPYFRCVPPTFFCNHTAILNRLRLHRVFWGDTQILCELWGGSANPGSQVRSIRVK